MRRNIIIITVFIIISIFSGKLYAWPIPPEAYINPSVTQYYAVGSTHLFDAFFSYDPDNCGYPPTPSAGITHYIWAIGEDYNWFPYDIGPAPDYTFYHMPIPTTAGEYNIGVIVRDDDDMEDFWNEDHWDVASCPVVAVEVDTVIKSNSDPNDLGPLYTNKDGSISLTAIPNPLGSFPAFEPHWTCTEYPGTSIPQISNGGIGSSVTVSGMSVGKYVMRAQCGTVDTGDIIEIYCVGVEITDSSNNIIEDEEIIDITVGEKVELHTKILPEGYGLEANNWQWLLGLEEGAAIGGIVSFYNPYSVSANQAQVEFYWTDGGGQYAGVGCFCQGIQLMDTVEFSVKKPSFSQPGIPNYTNVLITNSPDLITMNIGNSATVNQDSASDGVVKTLQVVKENIIATKNDSTKYSKSITTNWWIDTRDPFGSQGEISFRNGSAFVVFSDEPSVELLPNFNYVEVDYQSFITYIMYKSSVENSIWIPLAKMNWDWYGDAQKDPNGVWSLVPGTSGHLTTNPGFIDTIEYPCDDGTATDENPPWVPVQE